MCEKARAKTGRDSTTASGRERVDLAHTGRDMQTHELGHRVVKRPLLFRDIGIHDFILQGTGSLVALKA
jgi:hypothetical protein